MAVRAVAMVVDVAVNELSQMYLYVRLAVPGQALPRGYFKIGPVVIGTPITTLTPDIIAGAKAFARREYGLTLAAVDTVQLWLPPEVVS